jgi:3-deoxy-D-manno-octulosonate 8-phosphate phosphatase (KDO 8-P phosphatase)
VKTTAKLRSKAAKIRLLLLDVDGVLTDGRIIIDDRGIESKEFDVRDGQGIVLLIRAGIAVGFLTSRRSRIVARRARELGVKLVFQGVRDKAKTYEEIKKKTRFADEEIAYLGDDLADVRILRRVGVSVAVSDAWHGLSSRVDHVTSAAGGRGAVRELSEIILNATGTWKTAVDDYF